MMRKGIRKLEHYLKFLRRFSWRKIKRESVAAGAVTGINLLLLLLVFLLPVFFLPLTADLFEFNKESLFLAVTALIFLLWGLRVWSEKRWVMGRTSYDGPWLLFLAAVLANMVAAPSRLAGLFALPAWGLAALPLFYWAVAANVRAAWGQRYLRAFLASLVVLFLLLLGSSLLYSRWPLAALFFTLSPVGRPELAQVYFLAGLPVAYFLFKHRLLRPRPLLLLVIILLGGGLLLSSKVLGATGRPLPVLDWAVSAHLASASLKETLFFGQGLARYAAAFARFKPASLNKTAFWNYRAVPPANTWFYLLIVGGLSLTFALGWLTLSFFRELGKRPSGRLLYLVTALFFLSSFLWPWTVSFFVLPVFFLALTVKGEGKRIYHLERVLFVKIITLIFLILPLTAFFFLGRTYAAEVLYRRAYVALTQKEGAAAYNLLQQSLKLNPYAGVYHRLYAQANLFLVEDFLQKSAQSQENQARVSRLVEQAQREAKYLTEVLEPESVESWEVRAGVYRSLLGLVPTAAEEAEAAFGKARALSPQDPVWPWQLANLYLTLGESEQALKALASAVLLKDDWPQLYYTLAMAYDAQKNETKVLEMLNKLVEVTTPGTPERERALYLLEQRTQTKTEESGGR